MVTVETKKLTKIIGNEIILKDVNTKFEKKKIYGIVGRNGSGKTMFLKSLCGFLTPTSGIVLINKKDIYKEETFSNNVGISFSNSNYIKELTGFENLELIANIKKQISKEDIIDALKKVNLLKEKDKKYGKYSLGMKQKLDIAQAIMEKPDILLLDEPFNGLDDESVKLIKKLIIDLKNKGNTIIIATHIKDDIENFCDEVIRFDMGTIVDK
jgi:ABC-2 type transport system ATP-binding protein